MLKRYERVCFTKEAVRPLDRPNTPFAQMIHPGHPLMLAVSDLVLEQHSNLMRQGAILVDPADDGIESSLLFLITHEIKSGDSSVLSKRLLVRYDAMTVTTWAIVCGTALSLPAFLIPGAVQPLGTIRPEVWGALLYLAIGTNMIAYPLWSYALKNMDASKVAITTNTQPILTGAMSWLLFREEFTPGFIVGAALILAGVTWVETRR